MRKRLVATSAITILACTLGIAGIASANVFINTSSCPAGAVCVTDSNTSGYTSPPNQAYSYEEDPYFSPGTYANGTAINDRVNSVRNRGNSSVYHYACFYRDPNWGVLRVSVADTQPGWYDNSSVDLSSFGFGTTHC